MRFHVDIKVAPETNRARAAFPTPPPLLPPCDKFPLRDTIEHYTLAVQTSSTVHRCTDASIGLEGRRNIPEMKYPPCTCVLEKGRSPSTLLSAGTRHETRGETAESGVISSWMSGGTALTFG